MRNIIALFAGVIALLILLVPAAAQDQTVVDIAAGNEDFSTLVAAVEAAGLVETLSGEGPFTVLAPTNEAFAAALDALGLSAEELLANTELLTSILTYHVVSGSLTFGDLQGSTTTLSGEDITVDGRSVNGSATITSFNTPASNGIVHILDAVLIPPSLGPANIRVAHLSPDAPAVDVYVNGSVALASLAYPSMSDFVEIRPGTYSVAVAPAGTSLEEAVIGPIDLEVGGNATLTVAAIGTLANETLTVQVLDEGFHNSAADGSAVINVFHAIDGASSVNILANGTIAISQLAYPGSQITNDGAFDLEVEAGTYEFGVRANGANLAGQEVPIVAGVNYFIAAIGTPGDASLFIAAEGLSPTIVDILASNDAFSTLLTAAAGAGFADALAGVGPFTILAPDNEAFGAALEALGLTPADALSNPELLADILAYHVIPGDFTIGDLQAAGSATTLQGGTVEISGEMINGTALIEGRNYNPLNGSIIYIDSVLVPPASE